MCIARRHGESLSTCLAPRCRIVGVGQAIMNEQQLRDAGVILSLLGGQTFILAVRPKKVRATQSGLQVILDMKNLSCVTITRTKKNRFQMKGLAVSQENPTTMKTKQVFFVDEVDAGHLGGVFTENTGLNITPSLVAQ